jgi:hypothetical protein
MTPQMMMIAAGFVMVVASGLILFWAFPRLPRR